MPRWREHVQPPPETPHYFQPPLRVLGGPGEVALPRVLSAPFWLKRVRPDAAVDEAAAVLEDSRLRLVEPARRVRPQTLAVRGRAREDLAFNGEGVCLLGGEVAMWA